MEGERDAERGEEGAPAPPPDPEPSPSDPGTPDPDPPEQQGWEQVAGGVCRGTRQADQDESRELGPAVPSKNYHQGDQDHRI